MNPAFKTHHDTRVALVDLDLARRTDQRGGRSWCAACSARTHRRACHIATRARRAHSRGQRRGCGARLLARVVVLDAWRAHARRSNVRECLVVNDVGRAVRARLVRGHAEFGIETTVPTTPQPSEIAVWTTPWSPSSKPAVRAAATWRRQRDQSAANEADSVEWRAIDGWHTSVDWFGTTRSCAAAREAAAAFMCAR